MISADHGEEFGDHGGYHHGTTLYEEQIAVPLIWLSPDLPPRRVQAPVELVDIAPTLLSGMGIPREARMRGDDLGPVMLGQADGPFLAFADVGDERMVASGRYKLICPGDGPCRLYDLIEDPSERRNIAPQDTGMVARMQASLREFTRSIPEVEALALASDEGWPPALAEAALGQGQGEALMSLLADSRPPVRAATARALGQLAYGPAAPTLLRLADSDDAPAVRQEVILAAALVLCGSRIDGDVAAAEERCGAARSRLSAALEEGDRTPTESSASAEADVLPWRRRVALAGAAVGLAVPEVLAALIEDEGAPEVARREAVQVLAALATWPDHPGAPAERQTPENRTDAHGEAIRQTLLRTWERVGPALHYALRQVNLREAAADTMGVVGTRLGAQRVIRRELADALVATLETERYLGARHAETAALVRMNDPRAGNWIRHWLGTPEPLPGGVALLVALGDARALAEAESAQVEAEDSARRLVVLGPPSSAISLCGELVETDSEGQAAVVFPAGAVCTVQSPVSHFVLVPVRAELPPPPPQPWEAPDADATE